MVPAVIADRVSASGERPDNLWLSLYKPSQEEERGLYVVPVEYFHEAQGAGIVGAIIVGECELTGTGRQSGKGAAVEVQVWPHGLEAEPGGKARDPNTAKNFRNHLD